MVENGVVMGFLGECLTLNIHCFLGKRSGIRDRGSRVKSYELWVKMWQDLSCFGDVRPCPMEKMCSFKMVRNGVVMGFLGECLTLNIHCFFRDFEVARSCLSEKSRKGGSARFTSSPEGDRARPIKKREKGFFKEVFRLWSFTFGELRGVIFPR